MRAIRDFEGELGRTLRSIRAQLQRALQDAGVSFPNEHTVSVKRVYVVRLAVCQYIAI